MKNYQKQKENINQQFQNLLTDARGLLCKISCNNKIELQANGVTVSMIDPYGDGGEESDVISLSDGEIELENGSKFYVEEVTNLTDLNWLLAAIDE